MLETGIINVFLVRKGLTQTPAEEERKRENNSNVKHAPFQPLMLWLVGHQRHDKQAHEWEDASQDHDIHAVSLEFLQVKRDQNEHDNVNSYDSLDFRDGKELGGGCYRYEANSKAWNPTCRSQRSGTEVN